MGDFRKEKGNETEGESSAGKINLGAAGLKSDGSGSVRQKAKKRTGIIISATAGTLLLCAGVAGYAAYANNVFNPELNNPIYRQFESDEFQQALDSFKLKKIDINERPQFKDIWMN